MTETCCSFLSAEPQRAYMDKQNEGKRAENGKQKTFLTCSMCSCHAEKVRFSSHITHTSLYDEMYVYCKPRCVNTFNICSIIVVKTRERKKQQKMRTFTHVHANTAGRIKNTPPTICIMTHQQRKNSIGNSKTQNERWPRKQK